MSDRSAPELLAEALEHLDPADRQKVNAWLYTRLGRLGWLSQQRAEGRAAEAADTVLGDLPRMPPELRTVYAASTSLRGDSQVVPVRLPAELHARLRSWSLRYGFSMATIVRGLVARFLDERVPDVTDLADDPADDPAADE